MIAFVLSGGGNYGALQAGALEILLGHNIYPDILVGVSAGALNSAWLAGHPTPDGVRELQRIWYKSAPEQFISPNRIGILLRVAQGRESLLPNEPLQEFVRRWSPDGAVFGDFVDPRLYIIAARLPDGAVHVFGDHPGEVLFDGLMASTALPPLFPPWEIDGEFYVDGGIVSDLPILTAVERGADEIYALQITHPPYDPEMEIPKRVFSLGTKAIAAIIERNTELEIQVVQSRKDIRLHLIPLWTNIDAGFWNFDYGKEMIEEGKRATDSYFEASQNSYPWHARWRRWFNQEQKSNWVSDR
jgi:NTE family protein